MRVSDGLAIRSRREQALEERRERRATIRMAVATAVCLLAMLVGLVCEWTELLSGWPLIGVFVVSYVSGAAYSARTVLEELRRGRVSVDFLMLAAAAGAAAVNEWPEGAFLLFLFSLSNTLEHFVLGRTRRAITGLMQLTPESARVVRNGSEETVGVEELKIGDVVLVKPSERVPADGEIVSGSTSVDESPMTGESIPVDKDEGDEVLAGTLNQQGAIEVRVTRLASDTTLARMVRLVLEAQSSRAKSERFTAWFGQRYTWLVLGLSGATYLLASFVLGESVHDSFYRAMAVLVVGSPCAVVISIPAAILAGISRSARGGVLFKGGAHLEVAGTIRSMAIDKTGTLTIGQPTVSDVVVSEGFAENEVLSFAAGSESKSEHPLGAAIVRAADERGVAYTRASSAEAIVGHGISAEVDGRRVLIGKAGVLEDQGVGVPPSLVERADELQVQGRTCVFVGVDDRAAGVVAISDETRPSASRAIERLKGLGIDPIVMLTGDNERVAGALAGELGIEHRAGLLPDQKLEVVRGMRERHGSVAMVGDGINDAPSLAGADLGVSLGGSGTDVALETADAVVMGGDLERLPAAVELSRLATRIIKQNLVFAFSVMGVLLAVTLVWGLPLPIAVVGHEGSTVLVIFNALRLLRFPFRDGDA